MPISQILAGRNALNAAPTRQFTRVVLGWDICEKVSRRAGWLVLFGEGRLGIGCSDMVWAFLGLILALILNWLVYKPMFSCKLDRRDPNPWQHANPWQQYWGESYGPELKQRLLKPLFARLDTEQKIGNLIIDVGSGASPVTQLVETKPGRKRVCVDIAADSVGSLDELRIRLDAEKVGQLKTLSFRKALLRLCAFLGINPQAEAKIERADTIVFSDMLNYVDFRKVLHEFAKYLKPGGRIIVFNLPNRGNGLLFSDNGLKDNRQLYAFLEEHHFEIEHKAFPKRPPNETDESEELIVLVARKCVQA